MPDVDGRIIIDDEPGPERTPVGLFVALGVVTIALAVIALRPADVNPNSLGASPPTSMHVPPEALTTTVPPRSLQTLVPGIRGAIHFDVVTPEGRELWVWNVIEDSPTVVSVPGPVDISANRRFALATTENQAGEGVVWLGPKLDMRPAAIVPGLTGAVWHRSQSEWLVVGSTDGTSTLLEWWSFSGVKHEPDRSLVLPGAWEPVYLTDTELGIVTTNRSGDAHQSRLVDPQTGELTQEFSGQMWATTGPPVVYGCQEVACAAGTVGWVDEGRLHSVGPAASLFPASAGDLVAAVIRDGAGGSTRILTSHGRALMEVPFTSEVGAWSADGRFFVLPKTEFRFGDEPGLVIIDAATLEYHDVGVPGRTDWFVTNVWYGP